MCFFFSKKFNFIIVAFLLGGFYFNINAQDRVLDSLKIALKVANNDTSKIKILTQLSELCDITDMLTYVNPCLQLCEKALSEKRNPQLFYLKNLGGAINNLGYYNSKRGDPLKALEYYKKAFQIFKVLNDKQAMAYMLNNMAFIYHNNGDITRALESYYDNLKIQEEIKDTLGIAYSLNNIAYVYVSLHRYDKALQYYEKSLKFNEAIHYEEGMAMSLGNIGLIYFYKKNMSMALIYYNKSLLKYNTLNKTVGIASSLNSIGSVYLKLGDNTQALEYFNKGLKISEEHKYKDITANCLASIAEVLLKTGKTAKAQPYALQSLKLAIELGNPKEIRNSSETLKQIYITQNNFKEAFKMFQLEISMRDSILNESTKKESVNKELQYEYDKKELQSKLKQQHVLSAIKLENERKNTRKNIIVYVLTSLAVILCVSIFYLYNFFKQKNVINANKNNELKQKLLLSQMNPHFIFNSVDNIQSLIYNKKDKEAINYLTKFSKLTRQILENSTENYITLFEELNMTENYLTIQQLLYNNKFTYTVQVDPTIDVEAILIPPMLTQPFIENAIKHGLKNKTEGGLILIKFYMQQHTLFFEVNDNGSGIETKDVSDEHKSMATQIVKERLMNPVTKKTIHIHIKNIIENNSIKGVKTVFEIPYIYDN